NLEIPQLGLFKMVVCILILLGSIGFPIIFEVMGRLKKGRVHRRWSSNTVLTITVSGALLIAGTFGIFFVELLKGNADLLSPLQTLGEGAFYAVSTRTAGFNISDVGQMAFGTQ